MEADDGTRIIVQNVILRDTKFTRRQRRERVSDVAPAELHIGSRGHVASRRSRIVVLVKVAAFGPQRTGRSRETMTLVRSCAVTSGLLTTAALRR